MAWIVIGISGPTCSGKTSVAKKVHELLDNSILINQDNYFLPIDDPRHTLIPELNHFNWEILSSLDMKKMHSDILEIIKINSIDTQDETASSTRKILIVEGFSIFGYKPIQELCQNKFFIDVSKEICSSRRNNRVYNPADVPGYFDQVVWPEYVKYKTEIMSNENICKSIIFLDGSRSVYELSDVIVKKTMEIR